MDVMNEDFNRLGLLDDCSSEFGVRSGDGGFPCPICSRVYGTVHTLQRHVEEHLREQSVVAAGAAAEGEEEEEQSHRCPMCSLVFSDTLSLQEHVELHLEFGSVEEQRCREREVKREAAAEPKKVPAAVEVRYGLSGYRGGRHNNRQDKTEPTKGRQGRQTVSRDFHNSGTTTAASSSARLDDGRTRTRGVVRALHQFYKSETTPAGAARDCAHVWLSAEADHFCASELDRGWGCGYRNLQTLLSSLLGTGRVLGAADGRLKEEELKAVPGVPRLQALIEDAWAEGLDPQGAAHFGGRLRGGRAWIGATEVYVLLTSLGARARVVDFRGEAAAGPRDDTHAGLFEWVRRYFSAGGGAAACPPPRGGVTQTSRPPLYLQHQGHSRSVVGLEQRRNGTLCLLVLDPGCPDAARGLLAGHGAAAKAVRSLRKLPAQLKHKQYQLVAVEGSTALSPEEKRARVLKTKTWQAERVP